MSVPGEIYNGPFEVLLEECEKAIKEARQQALTAGGTGHAAQYALQLLQRVSDIYEEELVRFETK